MGKIALLLWGISSSPVIKVTLFTTFLGVYLIILVAHLRVIVLVRTDPQLHTPMYCFLSHLSVSGLCYSTAFGPKEAGRLPHQEQVHLLPCLCSAIPDLLYLGRF